MEVKLLGEDEEVKDAIIRNLCQEHADELILAALHSHRSDTDDK